MAKYVKIEINELINLRKRDARLDWLECAGVDNWEGYGEALYPSEVDSEDFQDIDEFYNHIENNTEKIYEEARYPYD